MEKLDAKQKLEIVKKLVTEKYRTFEAKFVECCPVYRFSNQDFYSYYNPLIKPLFEEKEKREKSSVLCVCSSGDEPLEFVSNDFGKIDCVDINDLSLDFAKLKVAGVKGLEYEEFCDFIGYNLNINTYKKIREFLDESSRELWDGTFKARKRISLQCKLFRSDEGYFEERRSVDGTFYKKEKFSQLKKKIGKAEINFINLNLFDHDEIASIDNNKYDVITLSNILDYLGAFSFDEALLLMEDINEKRKKEGIFIPHYVFTSDFIGRNFYNSISRSKLVNFYFAITSPPELDYERGVLVYTDKKDYFNTKRV